MLEDLNLKDLRYAILTIKTLSSTPGLESQLTMALGMDLISVCLSCLSYIMGISTAPASLDEE